MWVNKALFLLGIVWCVSLAWPAQAATYNHTTAIPCRDGNPTCWPDAFAFTPKGNVYYGERFTGQVRFHNFTKDTDKRFTTIKNLAGTGEQGLLGIALHPAWPDNPFGNYIFSYGHRNSYGFTFDPFDLDPSTVEVWQTENGPECNDELNYAEVGLNYGWGENADCPDINNSGDDPQDPAYTWTDTLAVTGAAFCQGCGLGSGVAQHLLVGAYNTGQVLLAKINSTRDGVTQVEELYDHGSGGADSGILSLEVSPTGEVYYSDPQGIYQLVKD